MNRSRIAALGVNVAIVAMAVSVTAAQDGCPGATEGVDLAVQSARMLQRNDDWVVLYTVTNRGRMASTSYSVALMVDGVSVGENDEYNVGLEPGRRRRWELSVPEDAAPPSSHELAVRVATAAEGSAAGPSYTDQCAPNDVLPVSQSNPVGPSRRGSGESLADVDG